jgi:TatD DNase family protein
MQQTTQMAQYERAGVIPAFSDAHCHLELFDNVKKTIVDARNSGVGIIITAGGSKERNLMTLDILKGNDVFGVVGIDPESAGRERAFIDDITEIVKASNRMIGIGEIGLDSTVLGRSDIHEQRFAFEKQIDIAMELDIPVVIHARRALKEVAEILERKGVRRAVFHYFEGNEEQAKDLSKKGYLISIPPISSGRIKKVINVTDINNLVAETDSPVVGKTPSDAIGVIEEIARIKNVESADAAEIIMENIKNYFYI